MRQITSASSRGYFFSIECIVFQLKKVLLFAVLMALYRPLQASGNDNAVMTAETRQISPAQQEADLSTRVFNNKRWVYGYGISANFFILPMPYFEAGVRTSHVELKVSAGYIFAYVEAKTEFCINFQKFTLFTNVGVHAHLSGEGYIYGVGGDLFVFKTETLYLRLELDYVEDNERFHRPAPFNTSGVFMPRIAIGRRF